MKELNWKLILLGLALCIVAAAAGPYVTLKLGQSLDLTIGGMFLAAFLLGNQVTSKQLAIQLNIIQTMISAVQGVSFMVVILAAFYYIQGVFNRDIGFNPHPWQMFVWLLISANLGIFMGVVPRKAILKDRTLPWPMSKAILNVAKTLSDSAASISTKRRRDVLTVSTSVAAFLTFLRDSLGLLPPFVGNSVLNLSMGFEFAAVGMGMLVPLSVGLSGLLGTWMIATFGERVASYSSLSGVVGEQFGTCLASLNHYSTLNVDEKVIALKFLTDHCGKAADFVNASSHFKFVVQWMMWPATAMMVAATLTSVLVPMISNFIQKRKKTKEEGPEFVSLADESIPMHWTLLGISVSIVLLVALTSSWFNMPWTQVALAIAIQPVLIVAGLRVLGITGSGPVSLMANATQFLFGLIWPAQIRSNLAAAYVSASPQAASENSIPSFWVAQRVGGKFKTLIIAQLIALPIGAFLTPVVFSMLQKTYGIGLNPGQLAAPTGLKIATLAIVMEKGLKYLPHGALQASVIAIIAGIALELLLMVKRRKTNGKVSRPFGWLPIPAAFGFALILPPTLMVGMAIGSVISASWKKFSPGENGSYELYASPLASGLIAGEAVVAGILVPVLMLLFS